MFTRQLNQLVVEGCSWGCYHPFLAPEQKRCVFGEGESGTPVPLEIAGAPDQQAHVDGGGQGLLQNQPWAKVERE